jgi:hypothetical protein
LLFKILMGRRKDFFEIYRQFGHAPTKKVLFLMRGPSFTLIQNEGLNYSLYILIADWNTIYKYIYIYIYVKLKLSHYRPERPTGFQEAKVPRFLDIGT